VVKVKIRGALFHCGRCRKSYSNPFGHRCVSRMGARVGKTKLKPSLSAKCPKCRKDMGNPLIHTCTTRTDFKRRTAKAKKDAAAAKRKGRPEHPRPSACRDSDCKRAGCVAYRDGHDDGWRDGYDDGFPDGVMACPLGHI
jgi:hypothetical protein